MHRIDKVLFEEKHSALIKQNLELEKRIRTLDMQCAMYLMHIDEIKHQYEEKIKSLEAIILGV